MPLAFFRAVEDTVRETLRQGIYGWEVTDCTVAMTHSGYLGKHGLGHQRFNKSISSTGEDFRKLTPLVVMTALRQARTVVCEPIHRFRLDVPADTLGPYRPFDPTSIMLPADVTFDAAGTIHVHATDTPGEWLIRVGPEGVTVTKEHAKGEPYADDGKRYTAIGFGTG